ncbi:MAG: P-type conjugative transfer protein TrbG [Synergistaceae bacterium]|nr:P-type conjugative transfer protein TrbG [Synergistaceae bacterium]
MKKIVIITLSLLIIILSATSSFGAASSDDDVFYSVPPRVTIQQGGREIEVNLDEIILMSDDIGWGWDDEDIPQNLTEITAREYLEEQRARKWLDIKEDLTMRKIDEEAMKLVKEFSSGKNGVPPTLGQTGAIVFAYQSYIPKITCRPMRVTDIILQPGEMVTGVFPGDTARWTFIPGRSGPAGNEQIHVLVKPLMADISTNLVINTDRRTYNIDLMSSSKEFMPSVSFNYPLDTMAAWDVFIADKQKERNTMELLSDGEYKVNPEELHFNYEIRGKDDIRWKPIRVWDDGIKTYIQFPSQSTIKSIEAPVFVIFEGRREMLVNYRVAKDMFIVDKVFTKAGLIAGIGAQQSRVVITRRK